MHHSSSVFDYFVLSIIILCKHDIISSVVFITVFVYLQENARRTSKFLRRGQDEFLRPVKVEAEVFPCLPACMILLISEI